MKLYRAKDYKDMSRKAANIISCPGYYETKLCPGSGYWFYSYRNPMNS